MYSSDDAASNILFGECNVVVVLMGSGGKNHLCRAPFARSRQKCFRSQNVDWVRLCT